MNIQPNEVCTLTDDQLIELAEKEVQKLIDTHCKSFTMRVPVDPNRDTDIILFEVIERFKKSKKMCYE